MGLKSNVTCISVAYGDYWDLFAEQWINSIKQLDPAAADVILVTDVPRNIVGIRNISIGDGHMADYFNAAVAEVDTPWLVMSGFDDIWLPQAMKPFDTNADAYGYPMLRTGLLNGLFGYSGGYESILEVTHNPMLGGVFHRTALMREMPFRRMGWFDWAHYAEMRAKGKSYMASDEPRAIQVRHQRAHSIEANAAYQEEIERFKAQLRAGG